MLFLGKYIMIIVFKEYFILRLRLIFLFTAQLNAREDSLNTPLSFQAYKIQRNFICLERFCTYNIYYINKVNRQMFI